MKSIAQLALGACTALSIVVTPACDDKAKDAKADTKTEANVDGKGDEEKADEKTDEKADAKGDEKADGEEGAKAEAGAAPEKIGVAVCDEYLEKYTACVKEHGPEAHKQKILDALVKTRESWAEMAAGAGSAALEQACQATLEAVKRSSKTWGCTYE